MTHTSTEQERAEFEREWMESTGTHSPPKRSSNGDYVYPGAYSAWKWWQAARRASVVSVPQETCVICGSDEPYTETCGSNGPRALCKKPAPQPPEAVQLDEIKAAWNAQADELNQWDELGEDEKVEWAAAYAVTKLAPSKTLATKP